MWAGVVALLVCLYAGAPGVSNWWLSVWTADMAGPAPSHTYEYYRSVYGALMAASVLVAFFSEQTSAIVGVRAASVLHNVSAQ